jgi:hypothetical protein
MHPTPMSRRAIALFFNALFVFYCTVVGVYLLLRPWSPSRAGVHASGFFRGFVSGLGLVHLAAGWSDLRVLSRNIGIHPEDSEGQSK